jgi:hypothetical protein
MITPNVFISDTIEEDIQSGYYTRELDGREYYRHMRAYLLKSISSGVYTREEGDEIDVKLEKVIGKILTGDWVSASNRLNEVVVEGSFTQEYKDMILSDINSYINDNY